MRHSTDSPNPAAGARAVDDALVHQAVDGGGALPDQLEQPLVTAIECAHGEAAELREELPTLPSTTPFWWNVAYHLAPWIFLGAGDRADDSPSHSSDRRSTGRTPVRSMSPTSPYRRLRPGTLCDRGCGRAGVGRAVTFTPPRSHVAPSANPIASAKP